MNSFSQSSKKAKNKKGLKEGPKLEEKQAEWAQNYLRRPSVFNTAPFQLLRLGKYIIVQLPFDIIALFNHLQEQKRKEQERLLKEKQEEEERNIPPEPKKPRKRKTFQIPEKELDDEDNDTTSTRSGESEVPQRKAQEQFISGGLWTDDDINQLSKLCSKYPGGFPDRWQQISLIMRRPANEVAHMAKRVLEDMSKKQEEEGQEEVLAPVKVKVKTKGAKIEDEEMLKKILAWSKDDQRRLETALQMYPKNTAGDRWAKVASHVGKSKEECMQRYKHLADMIKKKKEQEQTDASQQDSQPPAASQSGAQTNDVEPQEPEQKLPKDEATLLRKDSSSAGSSDEWCMVDSQKQ